MRLTKLIPAALAAIPLQAANPALAALPMPEVALTLEAETSWVFNNAPGPDTENLDTYLATAELALGWTPTPGWNVELVFLAEDIGITDPDQFSPAPGADERRPDSPHIDTATVAYAGEQFILAAGRMVVPFGNFETAVLGDPQTLELGETAADVALTGEAALGPGTASASLYNGAPRTRVPDRNGFTLGYTYDDGQGLQVGGGYISTPGAQAGTAALANLNASYRRGAWWVGGEIVQALEEDAAGDTPRAIALDYGRDLGDGWAFGTRVQHTNEFSVLGDNGRYREIAAGISKALNRHLSVGVELLYGEEGASATRAATARLTLAL